MEEQTHTEQELRVLSEDFANLIKKIAQYVKNETKTDLITSIAEFNTSKKDAPPSSAQGFIPEKENVPIQNVMSEQFKTCAAKSQSIDDPAQTKINCNLTAQEPCNVNNLQMPAEVPIAEPTFKDEHAKVLKTISQHDWLIEDLLQYPHNGSRSLVRQFFEYIQKCLRNYPVLITIFNEDPSKPTGLLFANRSDKLKELADIIRFNVQWLRSWLTDQFLSETIDLYSENDEQLNEQISSKTIIGDYSNFATEFHSTQHTKLPADVSNSPEIDSGFAEQSHDSNDVIEELLQTLDAVRLRALINQYDKDYDDRLRENVTRILNKPYVAEENSKVHVPATIQLLDSNKKLACRLVHAEEQLNNLQTLMTHFNKSLEMTFSNKKTNTTSSTTMTDPNPTNSTANRWFSPF